MVAIEEATLPDLAKLALRDIRVMARELGPGDVRYMVDLYYSIQEFRKATGNQMRAADEAGEQKRAVSYVFDQLDATESAIRRLMDAYTDLTGPGRWCKSVFGIGPVLTAGLLSHIDIEKAPTVGHIWRFAGLDPTVVWKKAAPGEKGMKRPYNAKLKVLCWKIGDSFVKFSNDEKCFYGKLYRQRKAYELNREAAGGNVAAAEATLAARHFKDAKTKAIYESGHLPDGRLDLRARRWATKLFLAHLHHVLYVDRYGTPPPLPYVIGIMGHADYIAPPDYQP